MPTSAHNKCQNLHITYVGKKLISWSSSVVNWTKLSEAPKIQSHVGSHPFKGPWAIPWALMPSVWMLYGRKASNASQASNASSRINLHIRRAKVCTQDMLKSAHKTC